MNDRCPIHGGFVNGGNHGGRRCNFRGCGWVDSSRVTLDDCRRWLEMLGPCVEIDRDDMPVVGALLRHIGHLTRIADPEEAGTL